jgi:transcriptional regulator of acetoin/glycerol metabolism
LQEQLDLTDLRLVLAILREGGLSQAARALGISRTNLHNKLRKHGLMRSHTWDDDRHN